MCQYCVCAAYFFKNVKSVLENDDLSIVNMEGTLTEETAKENPHYDLSGLRLLAAEDNDINAEIFLSTTAS